MHSQKKIKNIVSLLFVSLILFLTFGQGYAKAAIPANINDNKVNLNAKSAIAIDAKNGQVFYAKNANQKIPVASMSKLITIYLTLDAIKNGKLTWSQKIVPDRTAIKVSQNPDYSNVPLKEGHSYTIKQLYEATLIESANGAAMTLAKAVSGGQKEFVDLMRNQLINWKIKNAKIYTPDGLPNYTSGKDAYPNAAKNSENELSAADMAIIVDKLLADFPVVTKTTKKAHLNFIDGNKVTSMSNWNWMLPGMSQYDEEFPLDGLKTGTTDAAGACFTGTMVKQGRRIITVVMGASHVDGTDPSRFTETKKLLSFINTNYQLFVFKKGHKFKDASTVSVPNGKVQHENVYLQKDTGVWLDSSGATFKLSSDQVDAPLIAGRKIGDFNIKGTYSIKNKNGVNLPATVKNNVEKANFFVRIWRKLF